MFGTTCCDVDEFKVFESIIWWSGFEFVVAVELMFVLFEVPVAPAPIPIITPMFDDELLANCVPLLDEFELPIWLASAVFEPGG